MDPYTIDPYSYPRRRRKVRFGTSEVWFRPVPAPRKDTKTRARQKVRMCDTIVSSGAQMYDTVVQCHAQMHDTVVQCGTQMHDTVVHHQDGGQHCRTIVSKKCSKKNNDFDTVVLQACTTTSIYSVSRRGKS